MYMNANRGLVPDRIASRYVRHRGALLVWGHTGAALRVHWLLLREDPGHLFVQHANFQPDDRPVCHRCVILGCPRPQTCTASWVLRRRVAALESPIAATLDAPGSLDPDICTTHARVLQQQQRLVCPCLVAARRTPILDQHSISTTWRAHVNAASFFFRR